MYITLLSVLGILTIILLLFFLRRCHLRYKNDLENKIKQGLPLSVELLYGPFRVLEKVDGNIIKVCPIGKNGQIILVISLPRRMFTRIEVGIVYNFSYDYVGHEIRFDSNTSHSEESDLIEEDMKKNNFSLRTRILRKLVF